MKLGILSDTHDNLRALNYFVDFFNQHDVGCLCHAGDFISPFTIPALADFDGRVVGVFGNNDGDRDTLRDRAQGTSIELYPAPEQLELGGIQCLLSHRPSDLPDPIPGDVELVVNGHTHEPHVESRVGYRRINPGEAGGWLTGTSRAVLYDTGTDSVDVHMVPAP